MIRTLDSPTVRFADELDVEKSNSKSDKEPTETSYSVGDEIVAKFRGKGVQWYKGKIARVRPNGTYDIQYEDGDREVGLSSDNIRKREPSDDSEKPMCETTLSIGKRIEARYRRGSKYYPGTISRVRLNGTFDVDYDDGEKETSIVRDLIRVASENVPNNDDNSLTSVVSSNSAVDENRQEQTTFKVGELVEAKFRGKGSRWYKGKISRARQNGTFDVDYNDGDRDLGLQVEAIRHAEKSLDGPQMTLTVGAKIEARYRQRSKYEPGQISRVNNNGKYDVEYENGSIEKDVPLEMIRVKAIESSGNIDDLVRDFGTENMSQNNPMSLREGDKVEAKFRGKGKRWYKGVVSFVRKNGTYDINYDDGDHDTGLAASAIRKTESQTSDNCASEAVEKRVILEVGAKVEACYKGKGKFYPGIISRARLNGTFDIAYDDGDKEVGVSRDLIRPHREENTDAVRSKTDDPITLNEESAIKDILKVGSRVEARYRGKSRYYPGSISKIRLNGTYDIDYNDGEKELSVPRELIRLSSNDKIFEINEKHSSSDEASTKPLFKQGDVIEAKFRGKGSRWYKGKILRIRLNGTYDIDYDDGDRDTGLSSDCVRFIKEELPNKETLSMKNIDPPILTTVGKRSPGVHNTNKCETNRSEISAINNSKGNRWNKGIVSKVKVLHLYEIQYEDGEKDINIPSNAIREVGKQSDENGPIKVGAMVEVLSWQDRFAGIS